MKAVSCYCDLPYSSAITFHLSYQQRNLKRIHFKTETRPLFPTVGCSIDKICKNRRRTLFVFTCKAMMSRRHHLTCSSVESRSSRRARGARRAGGGRSGGSAAGPAAVVHRGDGGRRPAAAGPRPGRGASEGKEAGERGVRVRREERNALGTVCVRPQVLNRPPYTRERPPLVGLPTRKRSPMAVYPASDCVPVRSRSRSRVRFTIGCCL